MPALSLKERYPDAFPTLSDIQMQEIAKVAECHTYHDGDVLVKAGYAKFKSFVIQKGGIDIIDRSGNEARVLITLGPGEFAGDIANLTGRSASADYIAKGTIEVYEICTEELKIIVSENPSLSDTILKAFIGRSRVLSESDYTGLRVIGSQYSQDTFRIRDFLSKNRVLFTWLDPEHDSQVGELLNRFHVAVADTPIVSFGNEWLLRNPSNVELAEKIGIKHAFTEELYDLIIAGGGPAGLAAAVYGASEGLKTVIIEMEATGGQAGASSKIENYLGFPTGLSGSDLAARATLQAQKFGVQLQIPSKVTGLAFENNHNVLSLSTGEKIAAKAVLIASGAEYKKLEVKDLEKFEGRGIYYAATAMEAAFCKNESIAVVGGGNSAGQAAVFLSEHAKKIFLIVRGSDLAITMSKYLEQRIRDCSDIELHLNTEIKELKGDVHLEEIGIINNKTNERGLLQVSAVFSFIGAIPRTGWLPAEIATDEKGFILTGSSVRKSPQWKSSRQPFLLETTRPGIFAAGDVRSHSVKRVSSAVGEGSMAVQFVHEYLKEL